MAWNSELEMAWRQYHADEAIGAFYSNPRFVLIGDLVHGLMQRVFMHRLSPDAFSKGYDEMVRFVMGGVKMFNLIEVYFDLIYLLLMTGFGLALLLEKGKKRSSSPPWPSYWHPAMHAICFRESTAIYLRQGLREINSIFLTGK